MADKKKKGLFSAGLLSLGIIAAGVLYTGTRENVAGNKAMLVFENLTKKQGKAMNTLYEKYEFSNDVKVASSAFITYDATAKGYDPKNPKSWTKEMWLGNFILNIETNDGAAIKHLNAFNEKVKKQFPDIKPSMRKPVKDTGKALQKYAKGSGSE